MAKIVVPEEELKWRRKFTSDKRGTWMEAETSIGVFTVEHSRDLNWYITLTLTGSERDVVIHKHLPSETWAMNAVPKFIHAFKLHGLKNGLIKEVPDSTPKTKTVSTAKAKKRRPKV